MAKFEAKVITDAALGILVEIAYALAVMLFCFILGAIILWWFR